VHEDLEQGRHPVTRVLEGRVEDRHRAEQSRRGVARAGERLQGGLGPLRQLGGECLGEELLLRAEVVGDRGEVGPGGVGDSPRRRLLPTVLAEAGAGRRHEPVPGAGVPARLRAPLDRRYHTNV
jgi:hypothetical protein